MNPVSPMANPSVIGPLGFVVVDVPEESLELWPEPQAARPRTQTIAAPKVPIRFITHSSARTRPFPAPAADCMRSGLHRGINVVVQAVQDPNWIRSACGLDPIRVGQPAARNFSSRSGA